MRPAILSEFIILLAYPVIAMAVAWLAYRQRGQISGVWLVVMVAGLIVGCGVLHELEALGYWTPSAWVSTDIRWLAVAASLTALVAVPTMIPRIDRLLQDARSSKRNERRFLVAAESSSDAFYILESVRDAAGEIVNFRIRFLNTKGAALMYGTTETIKDRLLFDLVPLDQMDGLFEEYKHVIATGETMNKERRVLAETVDAGWLHFNVAKIDDGIAVSVSDISARKNREFEIARLAKFRDAILTGSPFATIVTDLSGTITAMNPAAERLLGCAKDDLIYHETPMIMLDPLEVHKRAVALRAELDAPVEPDIDVLAAKPRLGMLEEAEWTLVRGDGERTEIHLTVAPLNDEHGQFTGLILTAYDITESKRMTSQILHLATHDALTGLPTRRLFDDRFVQATARASRSHRKIGFIMVDLDHFKEVNDRLGHQMGDELLIHIAQNLQKSVRQSDTVARMGGDEFVVLLDDLRDLQEAEMVATKLLAALSEPVKLGDQLHTPTASMGICLYPDDGLTQRDLLRHADMAMYRVKAGGRNRFESFTTGTGATT